MINGFSVLAFVIACIFLSAPLINLLKLLKSYFDIWKSTTQWKKFRNCL